MRFLDVPLDCTDPCVVCGNVAGNRVVVAARHWQAERGELEYATCGRCASGFFRDPSAHRGYPEPEGARLDDPNFVLLLHLYIELGAGLDSMVAMLESARPSTVRSYLEIGCGMGLALDFVGRAWGVDAVGLEPSVYGLGGRKLLGTPVVVAMLDDAAEARGRTFDLIFASEVLEHVGKPRALLEALRARLSPGGAIVLTTPAAEAIHHGVPMHALLPALSAGSHQFLPSVRGMEELLREAGFENRHVQLSTFSIHATAGPGALPPRPPTPGLDRRLFDYYLARGRLRDVEPRVQLAFAMRAYDTGVTCGAAAEVVGLEARIDRLIAEVFDLDVADALDVAARVVATEDLFQLGKVIPYALPRHLVARARTLPRLDRRRGERAALAARIAVHGNGLDPQNLGRYVGFHAAGHALARHAVLHGLGTPATIRLLDATDTAAAGVTDLQQPPGFAPVVAQIFRAQSAVLRFFATR